jgi:L-threonylcarbamoyladenylate synthase
MSRDAKELARAADALRHGRVVAFPTETVYGLGASALDARAVERIYQIKGRPATNPLIVHVCSEEMARSVVRAWPQEASALAGRWWPGPLSIVLKKSEHVPDIVTAGLDTVAVRMPSHPVALELIRRAGMPLAAPSANRFTELSPTTAEHVRKGLGAAVDLIVDGGPCQVGIESTVVSLVSSPAVLLRPGMISRRDLENLIGPVNLHADQDGAQPSPGLYPRHYSPGTPVILIGEGAALPAGRGVCLGWRDRSGAETLVMPREAGAYAAALYETLHRADGMGLDWIAVERPPDSDAWRGILDRLERAAFR